MPRSTAIVGIVNITPDSFSDGGNCITPQDGLAAIARYIEDGADVVDIGAESTRPGATPITIAQEWERLEPVLHNLPPKKNTLISVDTRHADTARKALACGVDWINDVSGFSSPDMAAAVRESGCRLVMMHSLGIPADKTVVMDAEDLIGNILRWAERRVKYLEKNGIARGRIIFDPGLGFGKTAEQSMEIVRNIAQFKSLGLPILIGHSRKSFLGEGDRDAATLSLSRALIDQGVDYLRVHDVAAHVKLYAPEEANV